MKNINIQIKVAPLLFFIIFSGRIFAQGNIGVGGYLGGGVISGNSPNQSAFTSSLFFEFKTPFSEDIIPRISFIYAQDFNRLLPGATNKYFPFIKGISLKGVASQDISDNYFVEESAGFITINDHTFADVDVWNFGVVSSILVGLDFRNDLHTGWKLGAGAEFAFSFANTFAKYYSFHIQGEYLF
jgi:hypothetical protein